MAREVFPKLKELCLSKDLDFQVVDMRWGVTEDSQNDHSVEGICLQEVENCKQLSLGPNFVVTIVYYVPIRFFSSRKVTIFKKNLNTIFRH